MFSFWYGHYPHQVAEYDECPMSGFWNSPQTLSVMWRPWFSERVDLFHFFQVDVLTRFVLVETMVVVGGGNPLPKKSRETHVGTEGIKPWKKLLIREVASAGPYSGRRYPTAQLHWKRATVRGCVQPLSIIINSTWVEVKYFTSRSWGCRGLSLTGSLWSQEPCLVHRCILSNDWSFIILNVFLLSWLSRYGPCPQTVQAKSNNKGTVTNVWKKHAIYLTMK